MRFVGEEGGRMEAKEKQVSVASWRTFSIVSSSMILLAVIVAIFSMSRIAMPIEASMVRVANGTGLPLHNVRINDIFFGDLPVDGVSHYQALAPAYRYAALRLDAAGKKFEILPEDYFGETPLGRGFFTYRIRRQFHHGDMDFEIQDAIKETREREQKLGQP